MTSFDQSLEHLQLTIHNASALEMLADSIADILKHQKHNQKLIEYLAKSASFIENLEQFLQYNPITACPQLRNGILILTLFSPLSELDLTSISSYS